LVHQLFFTALSHLIATFVGNTLSWHLSLGTEKRFLWRENRWKCSLWEHACKERPHAEWISAVATVKCYRPIHCLRVCHIHR